MHRSARAGRPTAEEVVYNHIDIKVHPVTLQLDAAVLAALTAFFKVRGGGGGDDRDERRLDRAMGLSAIARAGVPHALALQRAAQEDRPLSSDRVSCWAVLALRRVL